MARFYITTAIVYTNAAPHIGFALELVQADAIARYRRQCGDDVRFVTGTDEHGTKIMRAASDAGVPTQQFVDHIAGKVGELATRLSISNTDFIRTTDEIRHFPSAQKLWSAMAEKGDLYKKSYEGYYCVGHEAFIKQSELIDGLCPLHKSKPDVIAEENWFFRLTKYTGKIAESIESGRMRIVPETRTSEILNLLKDAEDVSFSRPSAQLPWGIPVPGDDSQTMYVWADALSNYISALGYGTDQEGMVFWPADVHLIGKDITRFHAIFWPAMLMSAGLEIPKNIYVHGFITVDGEKMSKSIGNVIDPFELLDRYSPEVIRYFMLRELQSTDDSDFSFKNLESRYVSDLANGLGNLVQRVATLIDTKLSGSYAFNASWRDSVGALAQIYDDTDYHRAFDQFRLHDAVSAVWSKIGVANAYLNSNEPWKQEGDQQRETLGVSAVMIAHIAQLLAPFMPATAEKISTAFNLQAGEPQQGQVYTVSRPEPLFPKPESAS
ncbi:MAG: methionine--tRNA ligase [Candidatus Pacebacteria bacterium]|nr:methionine--tRNA ligase [Candidatus Paceibacterota bacterium]